MKELYQQITKEQELIIRESIANYKRNGIVFVLLYVDSDMLKMCVRLTTQKSKSLTKVEIEGRVSDVFGMLGRDIVVSIVE